MCASISGWAGEGLAWCVLFGAILAARERAYQLLEWLFQGVIQHGAPKCPQTSGRSSGEGAHAFTFKVAMLELPNIRSGTRGVAGFAFQPIQLFGSYSCLTGRAD